MNVVRQTDEALVNTKVERVGVLARAAIRAVDTSPELPTYHLLVGGHGTPALVPEQSDTDFFE